MMRFLAAILFLTLALVGAPAVADEGQPVVDELSKSGQSEIADPSLFDDRELSVRASPVEAVTYALPAGMLVRDFEASPAGGEVALVVEDAGHRQRLVFWRFDIGGFARGLDIPANVPVTSVTWHPRANALFLLAGTKILRIEPDATQFGAVTVYAGTRPLRRLTVGPRPFITGEAGEARYRLFFGERRGDGSYAVRSVTESGGGLYAVIDARAAKAGQGTDESEPNTVAAPFGLPVGFHPAGNRLIWEDAQQCLHRTDYVIDNWGETKDFDKSCGSFEAYTPNGLATLAWRAKTAGLRLHGLIDGSEQVILGEYSFIGAPSQMPDGRGVVALTNVSGVTSLRYLPIGVPLADVVNAWMYLQNLNDQVRFIHDRGVLRNLAGNDQIYQLYDSESYTCGHPDSRIPTRPYLVTTDLFWEVYGAAFDGLFIVVEREKAMPVFRQFVAAVDDALRVHRADTNLFKAFEAARAVLEDRATGNIEASAILAAAGPAQSEALGRMVDYGQFMPRGHYKTAEQKRYFAALRYLNLIELSPEDASLLRGLDPKIARLAEEWIGSYRPFIAASRLDLVWGGTVQTDIALHPGPPGTRLFPLSWAWDNEALDTVIYHANWPADEQIADRLLPSGLDFAAIAGSKAALSELGAEGLLARYPNLAPRIVATRQRFAAGSHKATSLYERWISALAIQWADSALVPEMAGALADAKRLQTGLASWTTLRHSTILVNDQAGAECGEGGFEAIVMRPPRGYVEPDPASFAAIAQLFDETIKLVRGGLLPDEKSALRDGIIRRLEESRDGIVNYQKIAEKEQKGEMLTASDYQAIQYVGGAAEHNFLVFMSLSNPGYALSIPDPMMKVADVAGAGSDSGVLEAAVGRPLEWDQVVPFYGRREIVKGAIYSYFEFTSPEPIGDGAWLKRVDTQARPAWVERFMATKELDCPAQQP